MNKTEGQPVRYRLIDIFATISIISLLLAIFAPYIRAIDWNLLVGKFSFSIQIENLNRLIIGTAIQLCVLIITFVFANKQRRKVCDSTGKKIGDAYSGAIRWKYWPIVKSCAGIFSLLIFQLSIAILSALSTDSANFILYVVIYPLQFGVFTGLAIARFLWRVYPGLIEFYEHGIVLRGVTFIPWSQVQIRQAQWAEDRLAVIYHALPNSIAGDTLMAQVSDELKETLLSLPNSTPNRNNSTK